MGGRGGRDDDGGIRKEVEWRLIGILFHRLCHLRNVNLEFVGYTAPSQESILTEIDESNVGWPMIRCL